MRLLSPPRPNGALYNVSPGTVRAVATVLRLVGAAVLGIAVLPAVYLALLLPPVLTVVVFAGAVGLCAWMLSRSRPYESEHGPADLRRADDGYRGPNEENGAGWL